MIANSPLKFMISVEESAFKMRRSSDLVRVRLVCCAVELGAAPLDTVTRLKFWLSVKVPDSGLWRILPFLKRFSTNEYFFYGL